MPKMAIMPDVFCLTCGMAPADVEDWSHNDVCWGPKDGFCDRSAVTYAKDNNGETHPYCLEHAAGVQHMHSDGAHRPDWITSDEESAPEWEPQD